MILTKGQNNLLTDNFTADEYFSKSFDAPDSHYLNDFLPVAVQEIRSFYGIPIKITSTFRTMTHNTLIGSKPSSQHTSGNAVDFQFLTDNSYYIELFNKQIEDQGYLFQELRALGINGFGIYDDFIHIDTRLNEQEEGGISYNHDSDHGGTYAYWNFSKKKVYESPIAFFRSLFSEDGVLGTRKIFITMLVVFLFPYMSYRILKK